MHLTIDPGMGQGSALGWACSAGPFGVVVPPKAPRDFAQPSVSSVAANAVSCIREALVSWQMIDKVTVEYMVHYPPRPGKRLSEKARTAIANDLLALQAIGGMVAAAFVIPGQIKWVTPHQWKGSTDTAVLEARLREPGCLSAEELRILDGIPRALRHNAVDAKVMLMIEQGRFRVR